MTGRRKAIPPSHPRVRLDEMLAKLRERNFRVTPQRLAILKILAISDGHPSAESVFAKVRKDFPTTSLATVYKTIALLKELNEVLELGFPDGSNRYDGSRPTPHPHIICARCNKIIDLDLKELEQLTIEAARKTGFKILAHRLDFFGLCPECRQEETP